MKLRKPRRRRATVIQSQQLALQLVEIKNDDGHITGLEPRWGIQRRRPAAVTGIGEGRR